MYICMYIYIYVCMGIHKYESIDMDIYIYLCICIYIFKKSSTGDGAAPRNAIGGRDRAPRSRHPRLLFRSVTLNSNPDAIVSCGREWDISVRGPFQITNFGRARLRLSWYKFKTEDVYNCF